MAVTALLLGWSVTNDGQTVWLVEPCANRSLYANVTFAALGSIAYWPRLEMFQTTDIDDFRHYWMYGQLNFLSFFTFIRFLMLLNKKQSFLIV